VPVQCPSGNAVFAGSFDGRSTAGRRRPANERRRKSWDWVSAIVPGPGDRLYSADLQGTLKAWDLSKPDSVWTIEHAHPGWLKAVALSPDGSLLASGARDGIVRLWSAADGKPVRELKGHARDVYSAAFHPDGKSLVTGDYDGKILHWEVASGKLLRTLDAGTLVTKNPEFLLRCRRRESAGLRCEGRSARRIGAEGRQEQHVLSGAPSAIVFDWETGKAASTHKAKDDKIDGGITAVRFMADGTLAGCAESQSSGVIWFWKPGEAEPFHAVSGQSVYEIDVRPDGMAVAGAFFTPIGSSGNGKGRATTSPTAASSASSVSTKSPPPSRPRSSPCNKTHRLFVTCNKIDGAFCYMGMPPLSPCRR
jgi:WD40 repeat protein